VAAHWLARRVQTLKKHVHPDWEYSGLQDLDYGDPRKYKSRAPGETHRIDIPRYFQLVD
jgi:hypothetical protein